MILFGFAYAFVPSISPSPSPSPSVSLSPSGGEPPGTSGTTSQSPSPSPVSPPVSTPTPTVTVTVTPTVTVTVTQTVTPTITGYCPEPPSLVKEWVCDVCGAADAPREIDVTLAGAELCYELNGSATCCYLQEGMPGFSVFYEGRVGFGVMSPSPSPSPSPSGELGRGWPALYRLELANNLTRDVEPYDDVCGVVVEAKAEGEPGGGDMPRGTITFIMKDVDPCIYTGDVPISGAYGDCEEEDIETAMFNIDEIRI